MKRNIKDYLVILASLLDDVIIIGLVFLVLWIFHVEISLSIVIVMCILFVALMFITHKYLVPAYRKKKITGVEGLIGLKGTVIESLTPDGLIKIGNEYWKAKATEGSIRAGEMVEVIEVDGLRLKVRSVKE